jgi:hypothetical protein
MSQTPQWYAETVTDDQPEDQPDALQSEQVEPEQVEPETTGDEAVDAVVASLRGLDDLPVSEHVAVFERAHESLRQVLSGAGEPVQASQA